MLKVIYCIDRLDLCSKWEG